MKLMAIYSSRVDKYVSDNSDISRNDIKELILNEAVLVNDKLIRKPKFVVTIGDIIEITKIIQKTTSVIPQDIPLDVIYEDDDLIVVNKKSGMVVHPAPGHPDGTLANALLFRFKGLSDINGETRPGIVHRIDKDTSGLLVVAKNNKAHRVLAEALKKHEIKRVYLALVESRMPNKITHIDLPVGRDPKYRQKMSVQRINSKHAVTHVYVEKVLENYTLVRCELETGRTHQIRVHLAHIGHPVKGDPIYGKKIDDFNQRLHAHKLEFLHPITNKKMAFEAPVPEEFNKN